MSLYAVVDGHDFGQVATVKGWSDFIEWANSQPYSQLAHLSQHGYSVRVHLLADQLYTALLEDPPSPDVRATAEGIEDICRKYWTAEIFIVTDGSGESYEDDPDDAVRMPLEPDTTSGSKSSTKKKIAGSAKVRKTAKRLSSKKSPQKTAAKKKAMNKKVAIKRTGKEPGKKKR